MVLTPDFRKDTVSADGTYCYLTDHTTYGSPGPNRNTLAIAMTAYKVDKDLAESAMVVATYNPLTVTQFQITNTIDGWVKFYVSIVPIYATVVTPLSTLNDVVYDTVTAAYYKYINSTPTATTSVTNAIYWSVISDPTKPILANVGTTSATGNIAYQIVNSINTFLTEQCYIELAVAVAKAGCDCDCIEETKTSRTYTMIDVLLNAAKIDDATQQYIAGERAMRVAATYCENCGCMSC